MKTSRTRKQPMPRFLAGLRNLGIAGLAAMLTACATTTVTVQDEEKVGAVVASQALDQIGLYDSEALHRYVNSVGQRLARELVDSPYTFRFGVLDQFEPNAFAAPGGYIFVSRGLLSLMNTEDELAGVLAHEISHVTQRHHARQANRATVPGLLSLPGAAVGAVVGEDIGNLINSPINAAGKVYLASYSRDQETEADVYGTRLAAKAGYDPAALGRALAKLSNSVELVSGQAQEFKYTDSHPTTPKRLSDIDAEVATLSWNTRAPIAGANGFYAQLEGLWWGPQNPAGGIFRDTRYLNADLDFTIDFPSGWQTVNTPKIVGAADAEAPAFIATGGVFKPVDPAVLGEALVAELANVDVVPAESRRVTIGEADWPGYLIRIEDASGRRPVSIYYLFVTSPDMTFSLIGLGAENSRELMRDTVLSMRMLTDEERRSITGFRVRVIDARAGETVQQVADRSDNRIRTDVIAVINGLEVDAPLAAGQKVKVITEEAYRPD